MFFLMIITTIVMYLIYFYANLYWKKKRVPYKTPLPLIGDFLPILLGKTSLPDLTQKLYFEFSDKPYFGMLGFCTPMFLPRDPVIIKRIMNKDFNHFQDRNFLYDEKTDAITSNNLFIMKNPEWRKVRNKLSPVFTSGKMKMMLPLMKECGEDLEEAVAKICGKTVECRELAACYLTDVICSCAFGIKSDCLKNQDCQLRVAVRRLFQPNLVAFFRNFGYLFAHKLVKVFKLGTFDYEAVEFLKKIFVRTMNEREASGIARNDFIDMLIDIKNREDRNDDYKLYGDRLVAQSVSFTSAGQEPSASLVSYALLELALDRSIQNRLRQEIIQVIAEHQGVTYEAVQDMKYLDMVVNAIQRQCTQDYRIEETGLVIEKGTDIYIPLFGLHYDPKYYPDPERFDPERFNEENKKNIPNGAYLPFGDGPRNCIGMRFGILSAKLGLIYFLKKYQVLKSPLTKEKITLDPRSPLNFPIGGIQVMFEKFTE